MKYLEVNFLFFEDEGWLRTKSVEYIRAGIVRRGKACVIVWFAGALFCANGCPEFEAPVPYLLNPLMMVHRLSRFYD